MKEKVELLKQEFDEFMKTQSLHESTIEIFMNWVFHKLAELDAAPMTVEEALERCKKWKMTDEELEELLK